MKYKKIQLSKINTLNVYIEETYIDNDFSILIHDDFSESEGGIWIEKFTDSYESAVKIAEECINKIKLNY